VDSFARLRGLMTKEIRLTGPRPGAAGSPGQGLDHTVEEILEAAAREAELRGRPVEDILAELGFDLGAVKPGPAPKDETPSASLSLVSGSPNSGRDWQHANRAFRDALAPLTGVALDDFLAWVARRLPVLLQKLQLTGWSRETPTADDLGEGSRWYRSLLQQGVDPLELAELVRAEPWFPVEADDATTLLDHFCDSGALRIRDVRRLEQAARAAHMPFWREVVESGLLDEAVFVDALAQLSGRPRSAGPSRFSRPVLEALPVAWVQRFDLVPLRRSKGVTHVACVGVPGPGLTERLFAVAQGPLELGLATRAEIESWRAAFLDRWSEQFGEPVAPSAAAVPLQATLDGLRVDAGGSAVVVVQRLIEAAHQSRATDIHLEPTSSGGRVRYRIDGICQDALTMGVGLYGEVVGRIKILSDLDVTERRRPQDGHFGITIDQTDFDMRISTVPAKGGEKVAIRLADSARITADLDTLGYSAGHLDELRELISRPYGMVLATGPVGSGKTTTLYSCLLETDRTQSNVMSIEDPVEVDIEGVTQLEVNYALGFSFVSGLRAMLRQDPDTILVGEIRDEETARISIRASMTGLRVFSTLHTNDAVGAITALRNFNLSPHLLASSLQGVIGQRLVRRLCGNCRRSARPTADEATLFKSWGLDPKSRVYRPKGCPSCLGSGFHGRLGVYEVLAIDGEIREMVLAGKGAGTVRRYAKDRGMTTLQEDGLQKVADGQTTIDELKRVLELTPHF